MRGNRPKIIFYLTDLVWFFDFGLTNNSALDILFKNEMCYCSSFPVTKSFILATNIYYASSMCSPHFQLLDNKNERQSVQTLRKEMAGKN